MHQARILPGTRSGLPARCFNIRAPEYRTQLLIRSSPRSTSIAEFYRSSKRGYASSTETSLKRTPLFQQHISVGAKMVPFGGYEMPLEYSDQSHPESHKWTRQNASLFDVSHMVQHMISGDLAEAFLKTITPSSVDTLSQHSSVLSCLLEEPSGGIVDDTVITRIGSDSFYFVTNAACREDDIKFIGAEMNRFLNKAGTTDDTIKWKTLDQHALLALQGPRAAEVLQSTVHRDDEDPDMDTDLSTLHFGRSRYLQLTLQDGTSTPPLLISRTGYTGEDGFEISIPGKHGDDEGLATSIAKALTADHGTVRWAGLAARDSLRLEAGMCLYGHDISLETTPVAAALGWTVGKDRRTDAASAGFNGASVILEQLASPKTMTQRRVGLLVEKGPAAREGAEIVDGETVIGRITSGCPSPTMGGQNIAMGLIKNGYHKRGTQVGVKVRKSVRKAEVARMPFVESKFYRPDLKGKD